jgi:peptidoglycan/xylan/chitin deacetylase (PgdA/CDA1 family)
MGNGVGARLTNSRATVWKRRIARLCSWQRLAWRFGEPRTVVLLYHSLGDDNYSVSVDAFERQMSFLATHATVVSLEEILNCGTRPKSINCAITWDDGYASVHDHAFAILEKYKFPSTVFVTTGAIGETRPHVSDEDPGLFPGQQMLTWSQIRALRRSIFSIGTHLTKHLDLRALSHENALAELSSSRSAIEHHTDEECLDFAYPWGLADRRCAEWVREARYRSASTTLHKPVPSKLDPLFVPRINIRRDYNLTDFRAIIRGDWDYLAIMQRAKSRLGLAGPVSAPSAGVYDTRRLHTRSGARSQLTDLTRSRSFFLSIRCR